MKKILLIFILSLSWFTIADSAIKSGQLGESLSFIKTYEIKYLEKSQLTIQNLDKYLSLRKVKHKEIVLKQIMLETGWLTSGSAIEYHNLTGMKLAKIRKTTAIGSRYGHAAYNHWTDSIKDYILWREYWESKGFDTSDYYKFLDNVGYATAPRYIMLLKKIEPKKG